MPGLPHLCSFWSSFAPLWSFAIAKRLPQVLTPPSAEPVEDPRPVWCRNSASWHSLANGYRSRLRLSNRYRFLIRLGISRFIKTRDQSICTMMMTLTVFGKSAVRRKNHHNNARTPIAGSVY